MKEEVAATTNFQCQFNDYLNSFDDILTVAADIYGIYMEVDEAMKNVKVVKGIVVRQPANVLAVALSQSYSAPTGFTRTRSLGLSMVIMESSFTGTRSQAPVHGQ